MQNLRSSDAINRTVEDAAAKVYAAAPDEFTSLRAELSGAAKAAGDAAAAKRIAALRKPTVSASLVNRLVAQDAAVITTVSDLGADLRAAQQSLDPVSMRDLASRRRTVVAELTRRAEAVAGRVSAAVHEEVTATFDAAVADPDIANRLGRLTAAERWSGFGFGDTAPLAAPPTSELAAARAQADAAQAELAAAHEEEQRCDARLQKITDQIAELEGRLAGLRRDEGNARTETDRASARTTAAARAAKQAQAALARVDKAGTAAASGRAGKR